MKTATALTAVLVVVSAVPAYAEWTIAGYLGGASTQRGTLTINQPALNTHLRFESVGYQGRSFDIPLYYGIRGGYYLTPHVGLEGEFIHLKVYAQVRETTRVLGVLRTQPIDAARRLDEIVGRFDISHGVNLILANFAFRKGFLEAGGGRGLGRVILVGRVGAGGTAPHPESEILGETLEQYQGGSWALQLAAGPEFRIAGSFYGVAEYKYTRTPQRVEIFNGHAESVLNSHHITAGLAVHF